MIASKTYRRLAASIAVAIITGSLAVGAQAAARAAGTPQASSGGGAAFIPGVTDFPARLEYIPTPHMGSDGDAAFIPGVTDFPARPAYIDPTWTPPSTMERVAVDSFQWADAGIGASLSAFGLLLAAGAVAARRRRELTG